MYKATLVRAKSENMTVAVKTIKNYKSEQETIDFLHEMGVMMDLMHPNIIHLYGIVQQGFIIHRIREIIIVLHTYTKY